MFDTPYQTTACRGYRTEPTAQALRHALVQDELSPVKLPDGRVIDAIVEVLTYPSDVPRFTQPMQVDVTTRSGKFIAIDQSGHVTQSKDGSAPKVLLTGDYEFLRLYARLMLAWLAGGGARRELLGVSELPLQVFERIISTSLVRRLGLEPHDQMHISAITAWFGLCQYLKPEEIDERDSLYPRISRITRIQTANLYELLDGVAYLNDLNDFIGALKSQLPTTRIQAINPATLLSAIGGIWYGATARETIAVAMEYPPAWLALIATALQFSGYRSTILAKTTAELDKRDAGRGLLRGLAHYLGD